MQKSVNRYLGEIDIDAVDHALGRPINPLGDTYRNHYCIPKDCDQAKQMAASDWWRATYKINNDRDIIFQVTQTGRQALADHLKLSQA